MKAQNGKRHATQQSLNGAFESRARRDPGRPFILFAGKTWSWADFGAAAAKTARLLAGRGVRKGDRIGVLARNDVGHALLLFACARADALGRQARAQIRRDAQGEGRRFAVTRAIPEPLASS